MNDIVGVNLRTFELARAGAAQVIDFKEDLARLFKPGEEVIAYQDDEMMTLVESGLKR